MATYPVIGTVSGAFQAGGSDASTVTLNTSSGLFVFDSWTLIDRSQPVPAGTLIQSIGLYASNAVSAAVKVAQRAAPGVYSIAYSASVAHPGGGWFDLANVDFKVPNDGFSYFVGAWMDATRAATGRNDLTSAIPRAYREGANVSGVNQAMSEDLSLALPLRYTAGGSGATLVAPTQTMSLTVPPFVVLILGQSNGGAFLGPALYTFRHADGTIRNLNPLDGNVATAVEPLAGVQGGLSCVASPLCDSLRDDGFFPAAMIQDICQGGARVSDWAIGGQYNVLIGQAKARFDAVGAAVTHVMISLGEQTAVDGVGIGQCQNDFQSIIDGLRAVHVTAPIFVAQETWANGGLPTFSAQVRAAVAGVVTANPNVYLGPDLDRFGNAFRQPDGTHFSDPTPPAMAWKAALLQ